MTGHVGPPVILFDRAEWMATAACRGMDPDLFHPRKGNAGAVARAKAVCGSCVHRAECLAMAVDNGSQHLDVGIWGGTTANERRAIHRRRAGGIVGGIGGPAAEQFLADHDRRAS